ncbi:epididymal sperm-binding protein 1-like isoform X5 [Scylla paramamosain]|uniref:epididymal sperm-binding protein 1-like isoform X5 n=1 Tax=Scylla paramamosain TaxID=85552 RepID=UPI0030838455
MAIGGRLSDVNVLCLIVVFALHAWSVLEGHVLVSRAGQLYQKPVSVPEVVDERDCVFPFWWKSKLHNNCTRLDRPDHWCATQINDAGAPVTSGYCKKFLVGPLPAQPTPTMDDGVFIPATRKSRGPESNGPITTKNGEACVVPYKFKGKVHMGCYCDGISPCWCPLRISSDYYPLDSDYCADNDTVVPIEHLQVNMSDVPMTVRNGPCTFPFVYNGLAYTECACVDAPECWCAVSLTQTNEPAVSDYCKDFLIGEIPTVPPPAYGPCINITKDGWACHLPFTYNGRNYTQCTTEGRDRLWCATLLDEQGDIVQWGYCADDDLWDDAVGERRQ